MQIFEGKIIVQKLQKYHFFLYKYITGGKIWCEVVEDLEQGTELLASFTTHGHETPDGRKDEGGDKREAVDRDVKLTVPTLKKSESKSSVNVTPQPGNLKT